VPETVLHDERLGLVARVVYAEMALWVFQGKTCSLGTRQIAARLHLSRTAVIEGIAELAAAEVITVSRSGAGKRAMYGLNSPVFGQKQGKETVVVSAPSGARRMVSVGPEVKTA
jgi:DNA-binding transcriptional regulator LsrR (DeoR family)